MNRYYIILFVALLGVTSCGGSKTENTKETDTARVTLSRGTETPLNGADKISAWKQATESQKLAFCDHLVTDANKDATSKLLAADMNNCLDEAIRGLQNADDMTLTELAVPCVTMLRQMHPAMH